MRRCAATVVASSPACAGGALLLGVLAACGPTAPTVDVRQPLPKGEDPVLCVTAAQQKPAIEQALRAAGFQVVDGPAQTPYLLRVTLGLDQGARACGTLNNVRYALRRAGETIVQAEAKGWTGSCEPNVFDAVSRLLRERVVAMRDGRE